MNLPTLLKGGEVHSLTLTDAKLGAQDASTTRPWFRVASSYNMDVTGFKPFIGMELSAPIARPGATFVPSDSVDAKNEAFVRSFAPRGQVAINCGVRF